MKINQHLTRIKKNIISTDSDKIFIIFALFLDTIHDSLMYYLKTHAQTMNQFDTGLNFIVLERATKFKNETIEAPGFYVSISFILFKV